MVFKNPVFLCNRVLESLKSGICSNVWSVVERRRPPPHTLASYVAYFASFATATVQKRWKKVR